MKRATLLNVIVTTAFYMMCGCMGYAAFGNSSPENPLTDFEFYNPYRLLDIADAATVIHLVRAYQVDCQPLFAFIEKWATKTWPKSRFITKNIAMPIPGFYTFNMNLFRLVWRTAFVILTTVISMLLSFFNDVVDCWGHWDFGHWRFTSPSRYS